MSDKIKVLVVDDSALTRKQITDILNNDEKIEVLGSAKNGIEALKMIGELKPDVVTLDIEMPEMDGLECLREIMVKFPTPVIILSAYTQTESAERTIMALEYGAVDFVAKPASATVSDINKIAPELINKVKMAAKIDIEKLKPDFLRDKKHRSNIYSQKIKKVVIIGASTGGPKALTKILPKIPGNIEAAFLIIQHMPEGFTKSLANRLNWEAEINIKEAENGDIMEPGKAYIAPGGFHMIVEKKEYEDGVIRLTTTLPEQGTRPAVNVTMRYAAPIYKNKVIGVILTGMGVDGTTGLREIKEYGGVSIVEDSSTCTVFGMPKSAIDACLVDKVLPLDKIADEITRQVKHF